MGDLAWIKANVKDMTAADYNPEAGDIVKEDGQYWYLVQDPDHTNQLIQTELSIITGRQPVAYEDVASIPDNFDYNYYYVVEKAWFCCELSSGGSEANPSDYQFFGWYYPSYPNGEDMYVEAGNQTPTYYISAAQYTLTPGIGDYDFVPGSGDTTQIVQVNQLYYQGGYENHEWLKKYVFHLEKNEYDGFSIQVDTRYADDASKPVHANVSESEEDASDIDVTSYDLIYVNGALSENLAIKIADSDVPCIINMGNADNENLQTAFVSSLKSGDADGNYVNKKRYFFKTKDTSGLELVNNDFARTFTAPQEEGFEEITKYIEQENQYRALGEDGSQLDPLSLDLSQARAVEYIINYQYKRTIDVKSEINVLQIMPDVGCEEVSEDDIAQWISGKQAQSTTKKHVITVSTCCEQKGSEAAPASNMTDGDLTTFWHSDWSKQWGSGAHESETGISDKDRRHYIDVSFADPEDIQGFVYTPRSGSVNGVLQDYKVVLYDKNGNELASKTGNTGYTKDNYSGAVSITFDGVVSDVSKMRIIFESALEKIKLMLFFQAIVLQPVQN